MTPEQRIDQLLLVWQEQRHLGRNSSAAELCRDCPELECELNEQIHQLNHLNALLHNSQDAAQPTVLFPAHSEAHTRTFTERPNHRASQNGHASQTMPSIPGYEIAGELGRGGMGVVYQARHVKLDRMVALKMLREGSDAHADTLARFRTEAEAIARLQHPNIVQVFEVGEHQGTPFLAMEFCPGGGLDRKLGGIPLASTDAAALVETLALAVEAAHRARIIHRDLKPANILLSADGIPKISDFGLARKVDEEGHTQTGAVLGTPSYMAPEQARGDGEVGPAVDTYALGAILYELLTGRPPFRGSTTFHTIQQLLNEEPTLPRQFNRTVPRDLESICLKCLEKKPAQRYVSPAVLAEDLRRFQAGEPIRARPVGSIERSWRWCRRNPAVSTLVGAVASVMLLGTVVSVFFAVRSGEDAATAERKADEARTEAQLKEQQRLEAERRKKEADEQRTRADLATDEKEKQRESAENQTKRVLSLLKTSQLLRTRPRSIP